MFSNGSPSTSSEIVNPAEAVSGEKTGPHMKVKYGDCLTETARIDKADLTRLGFDLTKLPELITRCSDLIQNHESAWKELQKLLYERTVKDLTDRIDAIRQGDVDVGVVTGQEARDIFAGKAITT